MKAKTDLEKTLLAAWKLLALAEEQADSLPTRLALIDMRLKVLAMIEESAP